MLSRPLLSTRNYYCDSGAFVCIEVFRGTEAFIVSPSVEGGCFVFFIFMCCFVLIIAWAEFTIRASPC